MMGSLPKMAWRNIWRNKRRTAITLASIGFGLAALLFQQSLITSLQNQMVEKSTRTYSSHIQIQNSEVSDPKIPEKYIPGPQPLIDVVRAMPDVEAASPRVIFTGLASSALTSKGALVIGIDPIEEQKLTIIHSYIIEGQYLSPDKSNEIVMGVKLARELDLRLGEKAVLMVQATDGSMAAEAFRISGFFRTDSPVYDGQIVYISIGAAQRMLVSGDSVSLISARVKKLDRIDAVQKTLAEKLKSYPVSVLTWKESAHEIVSVKEFQDAVLLIVLVIIFSIVALGIFNTMLMSLFERIREFGLMMSLGARPGYVASLILIESALLGFLGMAVGNTVGAAIIVYFGKNGIPLPIQDALGYWMPFDKLVYLKFAWKELIISSIAAVAVSVLAAAFPALRASRINPADALRHN